MHAPRINLHRGPLAGLLAVLLLAGCAGLGEEHDFTTKVEDVDAISPGVENLILSMGYVDLDDPRIVCERRSKIGSNIMYTYCITRDEKREIARLTEQELIDYQNEWERRYNVYQ